MRKRLLRWVLTILQGERPDGFTCFGRTIWFIDNPSPGLMAHELTHAWDQKNEGWRYYMKYLWWHFWYGYRNNPYERKAYIVQDIVNQMVAMGVELDFSEGIEPALDKIVATGGKAN